MSFKRDGNDGNLLSVLQKRRIKDLLAEDIPEEEAKLLSNGRFACLVCSHHPIFDTVAMLSVHRQGKKHKSCEEIYKRKNFELAQLIAKRKHEQFLNNPSTPFSVAAVHHSGVSTSCPYDPRVQKHRRKRGDRRQIVDLDLDRDFNFDNVSEEDSTVVTHSSPSSSSSSYWQEVAEEQMKGPIKHDNKLKNIFRNKRNEMTKVTPYQPKVRATNTRLVTGNNACSVRDCVSEVDNSMAKIGKPLSNILHGRLKDFVTHTSGSSSQPSLMLESYRLQSQQCSDPTVPLRVSISPRTQSLEGPLQTSESGMRHAKKKIKNQEMATAAKKSASDQKSLSDKYYEIQGSGWKKDWDGKWIKDEQAEFDSDEEPPDLP